MTIKKVDVNRCVSVTTGYVFVAASSSVMSVHILQISKKTVIFSFKQLVIIFIQVKLNFLAEVKISELCH